MLGFLTVLGLNKKNMIKNEDQLQSALFLKCWNQLPHTRKLLFHVPNGGFRNKIEAAKFKTMGLVAGVPDLLLIWGGKMYGIELKFEKGRLSDNQKELHDIWKRQGIDVNVFNDIDQAFEYVKKITYICNNDKKLYWNE